MRHSVRLGITVVASPLEVGAEGAPELLSRLKGSFTQTTFDGLETVVPRQVVVDPATAVAAGQCLRDQRAQARCVVAASWFEDYLVLDLLEECDLPVIAWARPGMGTGSLCGMQQLGFVLKELGHPYCFLYDQVDSQTALSRAWDHARAALRHDLRHARLGLLGHRVDLPQQSPLGWKS